MSTGNQNAVLIKNILKRMEIDLNTHQKPQRVADDVVVSLDYQLTVDGELVDSTDQDAPIQFLQGHGEILPNLESALYGMGIGDHKKVSILATDAYGMVDKEAIVDVPRSEFPHNFPVRPGIELELTNNQGEAMLAKILSVAKDSVKLDFNHPLAGKDLQFDVTVADLRPATEEEIAHGHVHDDDMEEGVDDELDGGSLVSS